MPPGTSRTGNAVAQRGNLVVIHLRHQDWKAGQPREYDDFWLGQVTSVTRAGLVRLLLELAAPLRTGVQRDALAAYARRR